MKTKLVLCFAFSQLLSFSVGFKFPVGGRDGWVLSPSEDYSHWSSRNRFLVNDTLYFKYKKGEDSVLEVTKEDYFNCNTSYWLMKSDNGSLEFKLARSGPFFFISGVKDQCEKGQKLLIVVLSNKQRRAVSPVAGPPAQPPFIPSERRHPPAPSPATIQSPVPAPGISPPPGSPDENIPPTPFPKAAASAMASPLPISIALFLGLSLFYQLL